MAEDLSRSLELIQMDIQLYCWYCTRMLPEEATAARERARLALEDLARELR